MNADSPARSAKISASLRPSTLTTAPTDPDLDRAGSCYRLRVLRSSFYQRRCSDLRWHESLTSTTGMSPADLSLLLGQISPPPGEQHVRIDAVLARQFRD